MHTPHRLLAWSALALLLAVACSESENIRAGNDRVPVGGSAGASGSTGQAGSAAVLPPGAGAGAAAGQPSAGHGGGAGTTSDTTAGAAGAPPDSAAGAAGAPPDTAAGAAGAGGTAEPKSIVCPEGKGPKMVAIVVPDTPSFCIDTTEVTQGQYVAFAKEREATVKDQSRAFCKQYNPSFFAKPQNDTGTGCGDGKYPPERDGFAVECVDFCDAVAYCEWAGKRLCGSVNGGALPAKTEGTSTESQWYLACSQGGKTAYPYGNVFEPGKCNAASPADAKEVPAGEGGCTGTEGVFASVHDLSGGVSEWEDRCESEFKCSVRGGLRAWKGPDGLECGHPGITGSLMATPSLGFRCCSDGT